MKHGHIRNIAGQNGLQLASIFEDATENFVSLITLLPSVIEPYQSVNADGATVRRYTIINTDHEVTADAAQGGTATPSQQPASPLQSARQATTASKPTSEANAAEQKQPRQSLGVAAGTLHKKPAAADRLFSSPAAPPSSKPFQTDGAKYQASRAAFDSHALLPGQATTAAADTNVSQLPSSIQAAIKYMQRRYGSVTVCLDSPQTFPQHKASPSAAQLSTAGVRHDTSVCHVLLDLQPTDPAWDLKQAQKLQLAIDFSTDYPQQGSFSICLASQQAHLSDAATSIVNKLIAAEAARAAGRNTAVQQLLRFVENRAGLLLHEAEDICLEAARRRSQNQLSQDQLSAQAQTQSSALANEAHSVQPASSTAQEAAPEGPGPDRQGHALHGHAEEALRHKAPPPLQATPQRSHKSPSNSATSSCSHSMALPGGAVDQASTDSTTLIAASAQDQQNDSRSTGDIVGAEQTDVAGSSDIEAGGEQNSQTSWDGSEWDSAASYSEDVQLSSCSDADNSSALAEEEQQASVHRGVSCLYSTLDTTSKRVMVPDQPNVNNKLKLLSAWPHLLLTLRQHCLHHSVLYQCGCDLSYHTLLLSVQSCAKSRQVSQHVSHVKAGSNTGIQSVLL